MNIMAFYLNANFTDFVIAANLLFCVVLNGCNNLLSEYINLEDKQQINYNNYLEHCYKRKLLKTKLTSDDNKYIYVQLNHLNRWY